MDADDAALARFQFEARVISWRGPSPFFFAPVPPDLAAPLREAARLATYGWGVVPVAAKIGAVSFTTSLFPKDATYLLPLKDAVRRRAGVTAGDLVAIEMTVVRPRRPWPGRGRELLG